MTAFLVKYDLVWSRSTNFQQCNAIFSPPFSFIFLVATAAYKKKSETRKEKRSRQLACIVLLIKMKVYVQLLRICQHASSKGTIEEFQTKQIWVVFLNNIQKHSTQCIWTLQNQELSTILSHLRTRLLYPQRFQRTKKYSKFLLLTKYVLIRNFFHLN